jgi:hypothetical protein
LAEAPLNQPQGDYDLLPKIEKIETGNSWASKAFDSLAAGAAGLYNFAASVVNAGSNTLGYGSDLADKAVTAVDDLIPDKLSLTGGGLKEDLNVAALYTGMNPGQVTTALKGAKSALLAKAAGGSSSAGAASGEANFAHYTSKEAAQKIISSGVINPSSDTKYVEGMTMSATAKDAINSGARSAEVRIGITVPPERIGSNPYTSTPSARMFQTQGAQDISNLKPVILPPAKPQGFFARLFGK